jgi:hypothetical protein
MAALFAMALRAHHPEVLTYDLLVGARVLRRTAASATPAEVLRPEVTSIVETRDGLLVCCEGVRRALFITRTLDGYDDVRAELATWQVIESLRGWAAWRRGGREARRQGMRGAVIGTCLASDLSLAAELETVRRLSDSSWRTYGALRKRGRALMAIGFGILLVVLVLTIWQVVQPQPSPQ